MADVYHNIYVMF